MSEVVSVIRQVVTRLDRDTAKKLRQMAADEETTMQSLIAEGVHDLLAKRGRKPSDDLKRLARVA